MGDRFLGYAAILRHHAAVTVVAVSRRVPTMKISARNQIKGVVKKIEKGEVASTVKIEIADSYIRAGYARCEAGKSERIDCLVLFFKVRLLCFKRKLLDELVAYN